LLLGVRINFLARQKLSPRNRGAQEEFQFFLLQRNSRHEYGETFVARQASENDGRQGLGRGVGEGVEAEGARVFVDVVALAAIIDNR
jgi:hypothetical protein